METRLNINSVIQLSSIIAVFGILYHFDSFISQHRIGGVLFYFYSVVQLVLSITFISLYLTGHSQFKIKNLGLYAGIFFFLMIFANYISIVKGLSKLNIVFAIIYVGYFLIINKLLKRNNFIPTSIKKADKLFKNGKFKEAIGEYNNILVLTPSLSIIYFKLGYAYDQQGQLGKAIKFYKKYIKLDQKNLEVHACLGSAYGRIQRDDLAIKEYKNAIDINKDYAPAHCGLAFSYLRCNKAGLALQEAEKAIGLNPELVIAYLYTGDSYLVLGQNEKAIEYFKEAISRDKNCASAYYDMAKAYSMKNVKKESIKNLKIAIELDPNLKERVKEENWFNNIQNDQSFAEIIK